MHYDEDVRNRSKPEIPFQQIEVSDFAVHWKLSSTRLVCFRSASCVPVEELAKSLGLHQIAVQMPEWQR